VGSTQQRGLSSLTGSWLGPPETHRAATIMTETVLLVAKLEPGMISDRRVGYQLRNVQVLFYPKKNGVILFVSPVLASPTSAMLGGDNERFNEKSAHSLEAKAKCAHRGACHPLLDIVVLSPDGLSLIVRRSGG
jgi:hypothetical protein